MSEPSYDELKARVAELEKGGGSRRTGALEFRVGEKGGVSVYGLGRFPVTLYYEQWIRLLCAAPELKSFLEEQKFAGKLKLKAQSRSLFSFGGNANYFRLYLEVAADTLDFCRRGSTTSTASMVD